MNEESDTVGADGKEPSKALTYTALIGAAIMTAPFLLGLYLIVDDTAANTDLLDGIGVMLGLVTVVFSVFAIAAYLVSARRRTARAQLVWFLLAPSPFLLAIVGLALTSLFV